MDAYVAELESTVDGLLEDVESLKQENDALRELIDDIKKDTAGTMSRKTYRK